MEYDTRFCALFSNHILPWDGYCTMVRSVCWWLLIQTRMPYAAPTTPGMFCLLWNANSMGCHWSKVKGKDIQVLALDEIVLAIAVITSIHQDFDMPKMAAHSIYPPWEPRKNKKTATFFSNECCERRTQYFDMADLNQITKLMKVVWLQCKLSWNHLLQRGSSSIKSKSTSVTANTLNGETWPQPTVNPAR